MVDAVKENRTDYEEKLVQYNRRLAFNRSKHNRLEKTRDEAKVVYERDRERFVDVMSECGRLIARRQAGIDECEALTRQLISQVAAYQATCDELYERRCVQYDRVLGDFDSKKTLFKSKYEGVYDKNRQRIALMDKITRVSDIKNDRKKTHREGVFAAEQILTVRMTIFNKEKEKGIADMFETIIMNYNSDYIQTISNYKDHFKEVTDNQKKYFTLKKNITQLVGQHRFNEREMLLQLEKIKALLKTDNSLDRKIDVLTVKKETATMDKQRLITENLSRKIIREENTKYIDTLKSLKNNTEKERDLLNTIKQDIMQLRDVQKQKYDYLKQLTDHIATIAMELNKFTTGEKQLEDYPEIIHWLLNVLNPLLVNCKINTDC
ncbi:Hypothetical protein CINCED_3A021560 [Cinara cedri]|uniref:Uncharacterized protein n=1 Tax=Cinara cedri TaxID=506608 RepID=A0A5E4M6S1_9HEMI|nr:Hypothetical protein CINCED_3A021560 [Cinara cedri]